MMYYWSDETPELTPEQKQLLGDMPLHKDGPGTILRDFATLLTYIQEHEPQVSKTYQLLSRKVLPELNAQLVHPIDVQLKRPQLKSYPNIQGLYLLLRATGLAVVAGTPSKPLLRLDEGMYASWSSLNPMEQYLTLLETWLLWASPEIVGEGHGVTSFQDWPITSVVSLILHTPLEGVPVVDSRQLEWYVSYAPGRMMIALSWLFGFLTIEESQPKLGEGWQLERIARTPLGGAVCALLYEEILSDYDKLLELQDMPQPSFGALQPVFQPYVASWQKNLQAPGWAFREGVHVFRVTLWRGLWRRIAVPATSSLDALADTVLNAFAFDHDHLYEFRYHNRFGLYESIYHPSMEQGPWASEVRIGDVPLPIGTAMQYIYDFGDRWKFEIKLERVEPEEPSIAEPVILEGQGDPPEQYQKWGADEW